MGAETLRPGRAARKAPGRLRHVLAAVWVSGLAACASHFTGPTSGPTATLRLATGPLTPGTWLTVQSFKDEQCTASEYGTRLATFTTTAVQGQGDPHSGVERQIPAGRPAVMTFYFQGGAAGFTDVQRCSMTQAFVPEAGGHYTALFLLGKERCAVVLRRRDGPDDELVPGLHQVDPECINKLTG